METIGRVPFEGILKGVCKGSLVGFYIRGPNGGFPKIGDPNKGSFNGYYRGSFKGSKGFRVQSFRNRGTLI